LRGEADALGFPAGKRGGGAIQAEIAEGRRRAGNRCVSEDFFQRPAAISFWRSVSCARILSTAGRPALSESAVKIGDGQAAELDRQRFGAQALAVANAAERGGHVLRLSTRDRNRVGLFEISFQNFQDARETKTLVVLDFFPADSFSPERALDGG